MEMSQLPQSEKINLNIYVHEAFPKMFNKDRKIELLVYFNLQSKKHLRNVI